MKCSDFCVEGMGDKLVEHCSCTTDRLRHRQLHGGSFLEVCAQVESKSLS